METFGQGQMAYFTSTHKQHLKGVGPHLACVCEYETKVKYETQGHSSGKVGRRSRIEITTELYDLQF